jgi:AcrR family transcriptional regulator
MKALREDAVRTRQRLLAAASEIFADKGYRDATISEICIKADANNAAVNYHFRDKESLYREAWRQSLTESLKAHPPDGGVSEEAPPEERLRGQIKALLERITDKGNKEFLIVQKEIASPTGLLEYVIREEIQPLLARIKVVIRELLGPQAPDTQIMFCLVSIFSQCINPAVANNGILPNQELEDDLPHIEDIEAYAHHVFTFSIGGIKAMLERQNQKKI